MAEAGIGDVESGAGGPRPDRGGGHGHQGDAIARSDLVARSTVAMIAGMAAFRSTFFGAKRPSRKAIVDELTQAILHGFLHREH